VLTVARMVRALGMSMGGAAMVLAGPAAANAGPPHTYVVTADRVSAGTSLEHVVGAADNVYYIKNQHSGKCMTVHGASKANGARVDQYACISGAHNQWWVVYRLGAGLARITGYQSGKCLSIKGGSKKKGAPLIQWTCNGAADQMFNSGWQSGKKQTIKGFDSQKCLDVQGASTANNAHIIQWSCNGRTNQKWYLTG
jgi:hypothetical protein